MSNTDAPDPGVLRVGLAGLGTVGAGVFRLLSTNRDIVEHRAGREIRVAAVSARDRTRDRGFALDNVQWHDEATALNDDSIDVLVEVIGGADGVALAVVEAALERGIPVVTANKALLAKHGIRLGRLAAAHGVTLGFEASVAGGLPVIKALREGLAANAISRVSGILNGTCNYILTEMQQSGRAFAEVLADAQRMGYAEADPSFDIDGVDSAHKLAILASVAFDSPIEQDAVYIEGIRHISPLDIQYADELGYRVKLLGTASLTPRGIEQRVHPAMVPCDSPLARVDGANNAVVIDGDNVGQIVLQGRGAGAEATASAVVADLIDLARGRTTPAFAVSSPAPGAVTIGEHAGPYYVRCMVDDRPGVIADIAAELRNEAVSVEALIQHRHQPGGAVPIVLTTHPSQEAPLILALSRIERLSTVVEPPRMIRIEP